MLGAWRSSSTAAASSGSRARIRAGARRRRSTIEYQLVPHAALHKGRPEVEELSGKRWLPLIEFEDGTLLRESKAIVAAASDGTLKQGRIAPGSNSA